MGRYAGTVTSFTCHDTSFFLKLRGYRKSYDEQQHGYVNDNDGIGGKQKHHHDFSISCHSNQLCYLYIFSRIISSFELFTLPRSDCCNRTGCHRNNDHDFVKMIPFCEVGLFFEARLDKFNKHFYTMEVPWSFYFLI